MDDNSSATKKAVSQVMFHVLAPLIIAVLIRYAVLPKIGFMSGITGNDLFVGTIAFIFYLWALIFWARKSKWIFYIPTFLVFIISGYVIFNAWWGGLIGGVIWFALSLCIGYLLLGLGKITQKSGNHNSEGHATEHLPGVRISSGEVSVIAEFTDPASGNRVTITTDDLVNQKVLANKLRIAESIGMQNQNWVLGEQVRAGLITSLGNLVEKGILSQQEFRNWLVITYPQIQSSSEENTSGNGRYHNGSDESDFYEVL
jgi:hypothetical protein